MALASVKNRSKSNYTTKQRVLHRARNTLIASVILLIVIIGIGLFYVWLMGLHSKPAGVATSTTQTERPDILKPRKMPDNIPIGSSIQSLTTPVAPGDNVSLTLRTTESAVCTIKVIHVDTYDRELARVTDSGLGDKTADDFGVVSWTWTMPSNAAIATWRADIMCTRGDKSTRSVGEIVVKR